MFISALLFVLSQAWADPASCGNGGYLPFQAAQDVPYQRGPDGQMLDIYTPKNAAKPYKTVMLIHGGCFQFGGKSQPDSKEQIHRLVRAGYAVVSVDYRLASPDPNDPKKSKNPYPTSLNDVQDAWCWLQNHGSNYGLKTDKMVAMGFSAGATLATYLGTHHTAGSDHKLSCVPKVAAVVDLFGRTNFLKTTEAKADPSEMDCGESYVGEHRKETNPQSRFKDADVLSHLNIQTAAPMFVSHGDNDHSVNIQNSKDLCDKLTGKCELKPIHNADHMFTGPGEMDEAYSGICQYLAKNVFSESPVQTAENQPKAASQAGPGEAQH